MPNRQKISISDENFDLLRSLTEYKEEIENKLIEYEYAKNVFIMMKYRSSNTDLSDYIIEVLKNNGLNGVRADMPDWSLTEDNVINPLAVLYCCKYGLALFDEPEDGQNFNPNVAYELGIMHYQQKNCLILINKKIENTKPFDLISKMHSSYSQELEVKKHIEKWITTNIKIKKPTKPIEQVAVALIKKQNNFLITKRKYAEGNLLWSFPAKRLKPGANEKVALVKEVFAETNIKIKVESYIGDRKHIENKCELRYWLCDYDSGSLKNKDTDELEEIKWVTGKRALELISSDIYSGVREILEKH